MKYSSATNKLSAWRSFDQHLANHSANQPLQTNPFDHKPKFFQRSTSPAEFVSQKNVLAKPNAAKPNLKRFQLLKGNQLLKGHLDPTDNLYPTGGFFTSEDKASNYEGSYLDEYRLAAKPGQQVHLRLGSNDFDAVLQLVNARTGKRLWEADENEQGGSEGITFIVRPKVPYLVRVTSYQARETGAYRLRAKSFKSISTQDFNFAWGYGLVDAAAAISRTVDLQQPFANIPDRGDAEYWHLDLVNAPEVWAKGFTGKGITVAVIDSGVAYNHPDLAANIWTNQDEIANNGIDDDGNGFIDDVRGWDFVNNDKTPMDLDSHGTHVAGTVAAANNGFGVTGVAPDAKIMPIRVLDRNGYTRRDNDVAKGIRYAANNGADIINLSLAGSLVRKDIEALRYARAKGVVIVLASGNERQTDGFTKSGQPARFAATHDLGISVGAIGSTRKVASFSNPAGNKRTNFIVAPGLEVRSTVLRGEYAFFSGTSMAAPHVAGVAALMLSAKPTLTSKQITDSLIKTANPEELSIQI